MTTREFDQVLLGRMMAAFDRKWGETDTFDIYVQPARIVADAGPAGVRAVCAALGEVPAFCDTYSVIATAAGSWARRSKGAKRWPLTNTKLWNEAVIASEIQWLVKISTLLETGLASEFDTNHKGGGEQYG